MTYVLLYVYLCIFFGAFHYPKANTPASRSVIRSGFVLPTIHLRPVNFHFTNEHIRLRLTEAKTSGQKLFTLTVYPRISSNATVACRLGLTNLSDASRWCLAPTGEFHASWIVQIPLRISAPEPTPSHHSMLRGMHALI